MFDYAKEMAQANAQILHGEIEKMRGEARKLDGEARRSALEKADALRERIDELERQGKLKSEHASEWADSVTKGFKDAWDTLNTARREAGEQIRDGFNRPN